MNTGNRLIAGIEAGGTKFNVALATGPGDIRAETRIPTTTPEETFIRVLAWLEEAAKSHGEFEAIGIGSFGPVDLDESSAPYGSITTTPKPGWAHTPFVPRLREKFCVPVGFDTDVNAAALGESLWGAGKGLDPLVYLTIGTGVGGGAIVNGRPLHGLLHPEMGHLQVPAPAATGVLNARCQCPFHDSCLEGFISGPAIAARWGAKAETFSAGHAAIAEAATTLARGLVSIIVTLAPQRVILGGGVMKMPGLLALVRSEVARLLNGYLQVPAIVSHIGEFIVPPGLGDRAGVLGAIALGLQKLQ